MGSKVQPSPRIATGTLLVAKVSRMAGAKADDPLYVQVARALKDEILSGTYPVGAQLPTEDEFCTRFSVSRYTIREALRRLREEGLVASRQGAGTVVIPLRRSDAYVLHAGSINDLVLFAADARFTIDTIKTVVVDGKLAAEIGVAAGDEWLVVRGFRLAEGSDVPVCWTEYYINRAFASVARLLQRHSGPIFPLIEDLFAVSIVEVQQEMGTAPLAHALAEGLQVEPGALAIEVRRTYRIQDGTIAQVTLNTHPATRFHHSMTMRRVKA